MTDIVAFQPSAAAPFQFQPTLDGQQYLVQVTWNLSGQRWYINVYTLQGALVLCTPMIASPDTANLNLLAGYFDTAMVFRDSSQQFEVDPVAPAAATAPGSLPFVPAQGSMTCAVVTGASVSATATLHDARSYIAMDVVTGASVAATLVQAVFATWNPSDKSANVTLSNGNKTAGTNSGGGARATIGKSAGKWVWEITYSTLTSDSSDGLANATEVITGTYDNAGNTVNTIAVQDTHGTAGYHTATIFTFTAGAAADTLMFALDCDGGTLKIIRANVVLGTFPVIPAGTVYPLFAPYNNIAQLTEVLNAGQSAFVNNVPAGYNSGLF